MQSLTEAFLKIRPKYGIFTLSHIQNLFPSHSKGAIRLLINRAVSHGELHRLGRALYCLERSYQNPPIHPFIIANQLRCPSYISFESALNYYGLIPEMTMQTASACSARSKLFETPVGVFEFKKIPCNNFRAGVKNLKLDNGAWAYIASPLRAIADLVYERKSSINFRDPIGFLTDSLRIDEEELQQISLNEFSEIYVSMRNKKVKQFLHAFKAEYSG
ncbi:MAG: hypothetical protein HQK83_08930 [Fibrobacteria bacterium]|nr:hypothetical protein [Fibrobacteria bacterium]